MFILRKYPYIDGLVRERRHSIANALQSVLHFNLIAMNSWVENKYFHSCMNCHAVDVSKYTI